jgi:hypothetical protein
MDEMELKDLNGSTNGSSIFNEGIGTIILENDVLIDK